MITQKRPRTFLTLFTALALSATTALGCQAEVDGATRGTSSESEPLQSQSQPVVATGAANRLLTAALGEGLVPGVLSGPPRELSDGSRRHITDLLELDLAELDAALDVEAANALFVELAAYSELDPEQRINNDAAELAYEARRISFRLEEYAGDDRLRRFAISPLLQLLQAARLAANVELALLAKRQESFIAEDFIRWTVRGIAQDWRPELEEIRDSLEGTRIERYRVSKVPRFVQCGGFQWCCPQFYDVSVLERRGLDWHSVWRRRARESECGSNLTETLAAAKSVKKRLEQQSRPQEIETILTRDFAANLALLEALGRPATGHRIELKLTADDVELADESIAYLLIYRVAKTADAPALEIKGTVAPADHWPLVFSTLVPEGRITAQYDYYIEVAVDLNGDGDICEDELVQANAPELFDAELPEGVVIPMVPHGPGCVELE